MPRPHAGINRNADALDSAMKTATGEREGRAARSNESVCGANKREHTRANQARIHRSA